MASEATKVNFFSITSAENRGQKCYSIATQISRPITSATTATQRPVSTTPTTTTVATARAATTRGRPRPRRPCVGMCHYYRSRGLDNPMEAYYDYS